MEEQKEHKRRVRYKGTHPRNYNEKYKELNPEKYQGTIEHVIQKGSTPAGMHIPILVDEILDFLKIEPGQNGLDATLGYGGHSSRMLACLQGKGHLCALDVDPIEMAKTKERLAAQGYGPEILTILHQNFANIDQVAAKYGPFDFILADLGVSSMQIDNPERGFSYMADAPLDMRMDTTCGLTAAQWLAQASEPDIARVLRDYGEERFAGKIARAICRTREETPIKRTAQLADLIARTVPKNKNDSAQHPATRSFQAIRIQVNGELDELKRALSAAGSLLAPDGVLAVISFHSLEDRIVKRFLDAGAHPDKAVDSRIALPADAFAPALWTDLRRIKPSVEECEANPRARSAVLRTAQRTEALWSEPAADADKRKGGHR